MRTIELETCPEFSFVGFYGAEGADVELIWDNQGRGKSDGAVAIGTRYIMPDETYQVRLTILEENETADIPGEIFWETSIPVDGRGLEVTDVVESSIPGEEGNIGIFITLGWAGRTRLQFVAPAGFEDDGEGCTVPKELNVYVSKPDAGS